MSSPLPSQSVRQPHPGKSFLTRAAAARALGVSITTIRRREGRQLHPVIGSNMVRYFDPQEIARQPPRRAQGSKVAKRSLGDLAAECFKAFALGLDLREIVTTLKVEPGLVQNLFADWQRNDLAARQRAEETAQREAHDRALDASLRRRRD